MWMLSLLPFLFIIGAFLYMSFSDKEKKKYHKIQFKDRKEYLCVYYFYGNKDLKSNIGVLFRDGSTYLLETEDESNLYSFSFQEGEVIRIEIEEKNGIRTEDAIVGHDYDYSKGYFSGHNATTFFHDKAIRVQKMYVIKMTLTNGMILTFESSRNPNYFFRNFHGDVK